jgi:hypothetical protein
VLGTGVVDLEGLGQYAGLYVDFLAVLSVRRVGCEGRLARSLSSEMGIGDGLKGLASACCRCLRRESNRNSDENVPHVESRSRPCMINRKTVEVKCLDKVKLPSTNVGTGEHPNSSAISCRSSPLLFNRTVY